MNITVYERPHGRTRTAEILGLSAEDEKYFIDRDIAVGAADIGPTYALYATLPYLGEDDEQVELVELSRGRTAVETAVALRRQCEDWYRENGV